ncbi:DUF6968 family protein [Nocardia sp. NPDC056000]|uniref:DUF6968 family protein n=1 Tax=Nocardia sp. NPDC056000 TaxID=3345674 RepID=UPI0035D5E138
MPATVDGVGDFGDPIATRVYTDAQGTVTVQIGRPRPWTDLGVDMYACPYRITGDLPDAPGGGDAYAKGLDDMAALMLAAHAIESVIYLWNTKMDRSLTAESAYGGWRLTYPPPRNPSHEITARGMGELLPEIDTVVADTFDRLGILAETTTQALADLDTNLQLISKRVTQARMMLGESDSQ